MFCFTAPIKTSITDFWQMIWLLRTNRIVMLTKLVEKAIVSLEKHYFREFFKYIISVYTELSYYRET